MKLNESLYQLFFQKGKTVIIDRVCLGLGYTAVTTSDGGIGLSYTYFDRKTGCALIRDYRDFEGLPAIELLEKIKSSNPLQRSMALALVNALNHEKAMLLPEDDKNEVMFRRFKLIEGVRVAMVGYFPPLVEYLKTHRVPLEILDAFRNIGEKGDFYKKLGTWAEVLLLTATSIINDSTEEILSHAGPDVKTIILGPSTPMVPPAFKHLNVHMLAGTVPTDREKALKVVRHGVGTRQIHQFSKKAYCLTNPGKQ